MENPRGALDKHLKAMREAKPPGSPRAPMEAIKKLIPNQVEHEVAIVGSLNQHFDLSPATHKLGAVYALDIVFRCWLDEAKNTSQLSVTPALGETGTYPAALARIRQTIARVLPILITVCPVDQREKVQRLINIWKNLRSLDNDVLANFDRLIKEPPSTSTQRSTTPPGPPPASAYIGVNNVATTAANNRATATPPVEDKSAVLQRLAAIVQTAQSTPPVAPSPPIAPSTVSTPPVPSVTPQYYQQHMPTSQAPASYGAPQYGYPPQPQPQPQPHSHAQPQYQPQAQQPPTTAAGPLGNLGGALSALTALTQGINPQLNNALGPQIAAAAAAPPPPAAAGAAPPQLNLAALLQALASNPAALQQLANLPPVQAPTGPQQKQTPPQGPSGYASGQYQHHQNPALDNRPGPPPSAPSGPSAGFHRPPPRGPSGGRGSEHRTRSRSPVPNDHQGRYGHARERSPPRRRVEGTGSQQVKWVDYDSSLPAGHIKVYSRTLFIGGVSQSEEDLRQLFSEFGEVQSCIVNPDKHHAFIKMYTRVDAERAWDQMNKRMQQDQDMQLRTRWGVGYGPRECHDFENGISVIPINRLTNPDKMWMMNAEYGGTGGRELEGGLCVEEPDIEIGTGMSSKALSRQGPRGGGHGHGHEHRHGHGHGHGHGGNANGHGGNGGHREPGSRGFRGRGRGGSSLDQFVAQRY